ncbi:HK97 family phage prohead protease [Kurthia sp. YJT4]|uniref:HK97 family phage prohead protease n=1 Tax=Kurthia sp. YJT4 TaxID=3049086 RepID=UPI00254E4867|nr:HK97 family phage prohead protease [Kurthia sp. YJT4]WIL39741.1 HK97 family phage prohead protease [Kurthia sp. YJT4]
MATVEKRNLTTNSVEIREDEAGNRTLTGYAIKWEMKSVTMGWRRFREQFKRGAFTESLTNEDQLALWSHDTSKVLGRTKNGTLRLFEDEIGLRFELDLLDTTLGDDAYKTIKRGDVDGVSFGFSMLKQEWDEADPDNVIRTITKAKLLEISPVAFPAYPDSEVSARSSDPYEQHVLEKRNEQRRKRLYLKTLI